MEHVGKLKSKAITVGVGSVETVSQGNVKKRRSINKGTVLSRHEISEFVMCMIGFFMGRVTIFGDMEPLGIPYLSMFFLEGRSFYIAAVFTVFGILTKLSLVESMKYIICISTMCILNLFRRTSSAKKWVHIWQTAGAGVLLALSGIAMTISTGGYLYFIIMSLLEGALVFSVSFIIRKGMAVVGGNAKRRSLTNEELISLSILAGGLVAGSADIYIGEVSLRYFFCSVIVIMLAGRGGLANGATVGTLLGLLLNISGYEQPGYIVILSVAGIIAGGMKGMPKQFIAAGFTMGCVLMSFYIQPELINTQFLFSLLFAGITFILLPIKASFSIPAAINPALDSTDAYVDKFRELASYKLHGFSSAFRRLSKVFSGAQEKKNSLTQNDVAGLIDDTAANVCYNCDRRHLCWEENFYNTYQTVFSILNACEKKGLIEAEDIPKDFADICINVVRFSETINRVFEIYKSNLVWHNRIVESRELVSQQLAGVSKIIDSLSSDLDIESDFKDDIEKEIINELSKDRVEVESVIALQNKYGRYEVSISHKPCYHKNMCSRDILPTLNRVLNRRMKNEDTNCFITKKNNKPICKLNFVEEQQFRLNVALAKSAKDKERESGDSYSFMELRNGQCIIALSDGMGSGKKAREQSTAAIELLEEFIETGFDKDISVKMINSVLLLKSSEDSFSTLDICSVDLYSGEAEFMKVGASSTFIARDGRVSVVRSMSLPVGIMNSVDLDISQKQLKDGDIILLVTDGILDVGSNGEEDKEAWVIEALRGMDTHNPQDIADYILDEAKARSNEIIGDDMTVVAARFWKKY